MSAVDVLAGIDWISEWASDTTPAGGEAVYETARNVRAAVAELIGKADAVAGTLEMPTLVKQSTKNPNAGFIDWRGWCALQGEVAALRAALARVGGAK